MTQRGTIQTIHLAGKRQNGGDGSGLAVVGTRPGRGQANQKPAGGAGRQTGDDGNLPQRKLRGNES